MKTEGKINITTDIKTFKDLFLYFIKNIYNTKNTELYNQVSLDSFAAVSFDSFLESSSGYIKLFTSLNLQKSDRVCIISNTSTSWLALDFAIMSCGLISVPFFVNASDTNFKYQIENSDCKIFFVQNYTSKERLTKLNIKESSIFYFNDVKSTSPLNIENHLEKTEINYNDIATIVYTSGTMGTPNGVTISHFNLISQVLNADKCFPLTSKDIAISFLPTAHIFQRMICYLYLYKQVRVYFISDYNTLIDNFKNIKPTLLTTVPRVLEKAYTKINISLENKTGFSKKIAHFAKLYAMNQDHKNKSILNKIKYYIFKKLVFSKILALFGGNIRMIISGGAKLNNEVYKFFLNIGLPLYQGYGMTEMSPVISSNNPSENKVFTVGKFFDNITYKILNDGELCVKGNNLMLGYYKNTDETVKHIDSDGFFHTGDIVEIDSDGFLTVKSRKKELFKTSNGKYIDPNKIEFLFSKFLQIEYSCVIADDKNFVSIIIFTKVQDRCIIENIINDVNKSLEHHEKIMKFHISNDIISPETGEITPSLKLRRFIIYDKYKKVIESFYN